MISCLLDFLKQHEYLAVWIEGLALVAIFIWDRIDAHNQNEETSKQITAMQDQISIAQKHADVVLNSQKPYLGAVLKWGSTLNRIAQTELSGTQTETPYVISSALFQIQTGNFGKTPAWMGPAEIRMKVSDKEWGEPVEFVFEPDVLGSIEEQKTRALTVSCRGEAERGTTTYKVRITVTYNDSFQPDVKRSVLFNFDIDPTTMVITRA